MYHIAILSYVFKHSSTHTRAYLFIHLSKIAETPFRLQFYILPMPIEIHREKNKRKTKNKITQIYCRRNFFLFAFFLALLFVRIASSSSMQISQRRTFELELRFTFPHEYIVERTFLVFYYMLHSD